MAYDGNGNFNRLYNWQDDAANGIYIMADRMDAEMDGFANGLSVAFLRDGQTSMQGDLDVGNNHIIRVADPTSQTDGVNKRYVDDNFLSTSGTPTIKSASPHLFYIETDQIADLNQWSAGVSGTSYNIIPRQSDGSVGSGFGTLQITRDSQGITDARLIGGANYDNDSAPNANSIMTRGRVEKFVSDDFVKKTGDIMSGNLSFSSPQARIYADGNGSVEENQMLLMAGAGATSTETALLDLKSVASGGGARLLGGVGGDVEIAATGGNLLLKGSELQVTANQSYIPNLTAAGGYFQIDVYNDTYGDGRAQIFYNGSGSSGVLMMSARDGDNAGKPLNIDLNGDIQLSGEIYFDLVGAPYPHFDTKAGTSYHRFSIGGALAALVQPGGTAMGWAQSVVTREKGDARYLQLDVGEANSQALRGRLNLYGDNGGVIQRWYDDDSNIIGTMYSDGRFTVSGDIDTPDNIALYSTLTFKRAGASYIDYDGSDNLAFRSGSTARYLMESSGGLSSASSIVTRSTGDDRYCRVAAEAGWVGTYAFARGAEGTTTNFNGTRSASYLTPSDARGQTNGNISSGTWRCMGYQGDGSNNGEGDRVTLWLRIS